MNCDFYWASHACDLGEHEGVHRCMAANLPCSEFNEETGESRFMFWDPTVGEHTDPAALSWGEWGTDIKGFRAADISMVASFEETSVSIYAKEPE